MLTKEQNTLHIQRYMQIKFKWSALWDRDWSTVSSIEQDCEGPHLDPLKRYQVYAHRTCIFFEFSLHSSPFIFRMTGFKPEIAIKKWHACLNIPSTEIVRILFFYYFLVSSALMNRKNVAERWIAELFGWCNVYGASNGCSVNVWYNWPVNFCNRK